MAATLIAEMPDAMLYSFAPEQAPNGDHSSAREVVLDYHPNPSWNPPSLPAAALTGLEGRMWIDAQNHELIRMEGYIFKPVNFGFGMLAHIYPGGRLLLEQTDGASQRWIYTHFVQHVTARALMLKTLRMDTEVNATDYQVVPVMTYQEAIHLLLETPLPNR
jgi:hypothetical protein